MRQQLGLSDTGGFVRDYTLREIAGHSALDVTMTIYAHTSLEEKFRALSRLGERLGKESLSSDCRQTGDETDSR